MIFENLREYVRISAERNRKWKLLYLSYMYMIMAPCFLLAGFRTYEVSASDAQLPQHCP